MPKPTFLQTLLNQPSQSYRKGHTPNGGNSDGRYHSVKDDMVRVAEASRIRIGISPAPALPPLPAAHPPSTHSPQIILPLSVPSAPVDDSDHELFFTPSPSPRHSGADQDNYLTTSANSMGAPLEQPTLHALMDKEASAIAAAASAAAAAAEANANQDVNVSYVNDVHPGPLPEPSSDDVNRQLAPQRKPHRPLRNASVSSSQSVASSASQDGTTSEGSWPTSFSGPSTSTRATTPATSESGHTRSSSSKTRSSILRRKKAGNKGSPTTAYTDDDWAKDVRWLVSPTETSSDKRKTWQAVSGGSSITTSPAATVSKRKPRPLFDLDHTTLLPTLPIVQPLQFHAPHRRAASQSTTRRTMGRRRMSALWEEDEGDEMAPNSPRRVHTDPAPLSSFARARSLSPPQQRTSLERARSPTGMISGDTGSLAASSAPSSAFTGASRTVDLPNPLPVTDGGTPTGFTSLVLPRAAHIPTSKRYSLLFGNNSAVDITRMGLAQTTMSTISITKNAASSSLSGARPRFFSLSSLSLLTPGSHTKSDLPRTPSHLLGTLPRPLGFTSHTPPPSKVNSHQVLVQVYAVAVDGLDDRIVSEKVGRKDCYGFVPGRAFVGRAVEVGFEVNNVARSDWVIGLLDVRKCGGLAEFVTVEKRRAARCPRPSPSLTLEQLALLPLCGVSAHRAVRTAWIDADTEPDTVRGRALVLQGHDGTGALTVQALSHAGMHVTAHIPLHSETCRMRTPSTSTASSSETSDEKDHNVDFRIAPSNTRGAEERVRRWGARGVRVGDAAEVVENCDAGAFDLVIDTVGGKRIWEACQHVLAASGQFTTLIGDVASSPSPSPPISAGSSPSPPPHSHSPFHFGHHSNHSKTHHDKAGGGGRAVPSINQHFRANLRSLRRAFQARKAIGYALVSPAADVDQFGEDVRDSLVEAVRRATAGVFVPFVGDYDEDDEKGKGRSLARVVPFERAPELFGCGTLNDGRTGVVRIVD